MYGNFDFRPVFWIAGFGLGALLGGLLAFAAWAVAPFGWWSVAGPLVAGFIGAGLAVRYAR